MGFEAIVAKLQRGLTARGVSEEEAMVAFGPANPAELTYLSDLPGTYGHRNPVYQKGMEELIGLRVPSRVLEFYRQYEPKNVPMLKGYIRLLALASIRQEHTSLAPGVYLIRHGVVVFATTVGGHAVCLDLNQPHADEPRVILVDHTLCAHDEDSGVVECGNVPDAVYDEHVSAGKPFTLTYELIAKCAPEIAPTFSEFLRRLAYNEYEDVEKLLA